MWDTVVNRLLLLMPSAPTSAPQVLVVSTPQLREVVLDVLHQATLAARDEGREEAEQEALDRRVGYITNRDAIRRLGLSAPTLARWREDGLAYARVRQTVVYRIEDLQAYIERHRVQ